MLLGRACRGSEHPLQVPTRLQWPGRLRPHEAEQNLGPWELEGCRCADGATSESAAFERPGTGAFGANLLALGSEFVARSEQAG